MAVTAYTKTRSGSRSRTSANTDKPWLVPAVIGVGSLAALLFLFVAVNNPAPRAGAKAPVQAQITGLPAYAQTEQGAVAAATAFEKYFLVADLDEAEVARAKVMAQVAPKGKEAVGKQFEELMAAQTESPLYAAKDASGVYIADVVPLKFFVESYADTEATISIWSMTVSGIEGQAVPRVSYVRDRISLVRDANTWKVSSYAQRPAPVPYVSAAQRTTTESGFYEEMEGGELYEQAP